jgi:hypothetical protein
VYYCLENTESSYNTRMLYNENPHRGYHVTQTLQEREKSGHFGSVGGSNEVSPCLGSSGAGNHRVRRAPDRMTTRSVTTRKMKSSATTGDTPGSGRRLETHGTATASERQRRRRQGWTGGEGEGGVGDTATRSRRQRSDGERCSVRLFAQG